MIVSDFILQTRAELQEKKEFWNDSELLIKLQRSYVSLQFDLPYFISSELLNIKKGKAECYLEHKALKDIYVDIAGTSYKYIDIDNLHKDRTQNFYTFIGNEILFNNVFLKDTTGIISYKYEKTLKTNKCEIEIPNNWHKALRLLFMSEIHEKPTRNTKERNLSDYYAKKYDKEVYKLKREQKAIPKNVTSNYQRI